MNPTQGRHRRRQYSAASSHRNSRGRRPMSGRRPFSSHRNSGGGRGRGQGRKMPSFDPSRFINTNPITEQVEVYVPKHKFADFGFEQKLLRSLRAAGLNSPSPIQDQIIGEILDGRDVVGIAETGTGKTAAFLLPLIEKTLKEYRRQTLILTPTRELALQIEQELKKLSAGSKIFSTVCVGGTGIRPQIYQLKRQNHFIIGTPGRLLDLLERGDLKTSSITTVVLDEADRMLDMGFIDPIRQILSEVPKNRETLFFSATMDARTKGLIGDFLKNPVVVSVKKKDVTDSIRQDIVRYGHHDKFETLTSLLAAPNFTRVIIFGGMKHSVEKLSEELNRHGIVSESLHGNKNHGQRQRALGNFKSGRARVLVATDVAARGIHVDNVSHVINYDLPNTFEDYVHRIGRTGRGNNKGEALTFVPSSEVRA